MATAIKHSLWDQTHKTYTSPTINQINLSLNLTTRRKPVIINEYASWISYIKGHIGYVWNKWRVDLCMRNLLTWYTIWLYNYQLFTKLKSSITKWRFVSSSTTTEDTNSFKPFALFTCWKCLPFSFHAPKKINMQRKERKVIWKRERKREKE